VEDDPPGRVARTAGARLVDVRVVAAAERIALEAARTFLASEPEVVTGSAAPSLMPKGGIAEDASGVAASLGAPDPELADVGAAWGPRTRSPLGGV